MNKPIADIPHPKMLLDPYAAWAANEGVPVIEDFGVDLLKVPTAPWRRFGIDGALVHLKGRGDFVSIFVLELAPGAKSAPQKHLFEEVVYVLSGHGNTTIETSDGRKHSFEWGPKSLFALPLNTRYQHFNSSGRERARLASTNNLALILNLFHNEAFVFDNGYDFPERQGAAKYFSGEGEFIPVRPGQHVGDQLRPRSRRLRAQDLGAARRRRIEHDVHPRRRHHARAHLADAGRHLQEGAPPRSRLSRLRRHRPRFLAAVVRGRKGLRAHRLEAWLGVRAAGPDVPPTLQYGSRSCALPRRRLRQPALPVHHRQAPRVLGDGRERQGRRLPDRIRAPGSTHPWNLSRGARQARRDVGHGQVRGRAALRQGSGIVRWI